MRQDHLHGAQEDGVSGLFMPLATVPLDESSTGRQIPHRAECNEASDRSYFCTPAQEQAQVGWIFMLS